MCVTKVMFIFIYVCILNLLWPQNVEGNELVLGIKEWEKY